jgi:hypothetical protein
MRSGWVSLAVSATQSRSAVFVVVIGLVSSLGPADFRRTSGGAGPVWN